MPSENGPRNNDGAAGKSIKTSIAQQNFAREKTDGSSQVPSYVEYGLFSKLPFRALYLMDGFLRDTGLGALDFF